MLVLTLWAVWPGAGARLQAGAAMVPVAVIDPSLALYGSFTGPVLAGKAPALAASSFSVQVTQVLEAGGRAAFALAVAVAMLATVPRAT